jgi:hypothetical protein
MAGPCEHGNKTPGSVFLVSERLLASQDGLCSMELLSAYRNSDGSGGVKGEGAQLTVC